MPNPSLTIGRYDSLGYPLSGSLSSKSQTFGVGRPNFHEVSKHRQGQVSNKHST
jgi:hypothetical protein